jgi:F-type H+-transporting ATPase subunit b
VRSVEAARQELLRAEQDARRIRETIERDARREAQDILAEANAEARRLIHNAHGEFERARLAARDKLRVEMIERALELARKEAASRIDERVDVKLVDRFIAELERGGG